MAGIEQLKSLLSRAQANGARSTVLSDLRWFIAIVLSGLVLSPKDRTAPWVILLLGVTLGVAALLYLVAYIYFALSDPDALRSEKFTLSKMAIEKTIMGDNIAGFFEIDEGDTNPRLLETPTEKGVEDE